MDCFYSFKHSYSVHKAQNANTIVYLSDSLRNLDSGLCATLARKAMFAFVFVSLHENEITHCQISHTAVRRTKIHRHTKPHVPLLKSLGPMRGGRIFTLNVKVGRKRRRMVSFKPGPLHPLRKSPLYHSYRGMCEIQTPFRHLGGQKTSCPCGE